MTSPYTQIDKLRMTIARQSRWIEALEREIRMLREALLCPPDVERLNGLVEYLRAENNLLRAANRSLAGEGRRE